jgi:hypothetical protein
MIRSLSSTRPVKLIVLDSIAALFRAKSDGKTTMMSLVQRSKFSGEISSKLRSFAQKHRIAIVVINEVTDVFYSLLPETDPKTGRQEVLYQHQNQFLARANTIEGEGKKEASMGLSWTNQINARIMMSRTERRRFIEQDEDGERTAKRRRIGTVAGAATYEDIHSSIEQTAILRRMSVVFSPVSRNMSVDFVITQQGVEGIELDDRYMDSTGSQTATKSPTASTSNHDPSTFGAHCSVEPPPELYTFSEGLGGNGSDAALWKEVDEISQSEAISALESQQAEDVPLLDPKPQLPASVGPSNDAPSNVKKKPLRSEDSLLWSGMDDLTQFVTEEVLDDVAVDNSLSGEPSQGKRTIRLGGAVGQDAEASPSAEFEDGLWDNLPDLSQYVAG